MDSNTRNKFIVILIFITLLLGVGVSFYNKKDVEPFVNCNTGNNNIHQLNKDYINKAMEWVEKHTNTDVERINTERGFETEVTGGEYTTLSLRNLITYLDTFMGYSATNNTLTIIPNTNVSGKLSVFSPVSTSNYVSLDMLPTSTFIYGLGIRSSTLATYTSKYFSVYGTNAAKTDAQYAFRVDATNGDTDVTGNLYSSGRLTTIAGQNVTVGTGSTKGKISLYSTVSTSNYCSLDIEDGTNKYGFGLRFSTLAAYSNKYFSVYGTNAAKTDAQYAFRVDVTNGNTDVTGILYSSGRLTTISGQYVTIGNGSTTGRIYFYSPTTASNFCSLDFSGSSGQYGFGRRANTLATYSLKYFSVYGTNATKTDSQYAFRVDATNGDTEVKGKLSVFSPSSISNNVSLDLWSNSGQYGLGIRSSTLAAYSQKYFTVYGTNAAKTDAQYAFRIDATNGNTEASGTLYSSGITLQREGVSSSLITGPTNSRIIFDENGSNEISLVGATVSSFGIEVNIWTPPPGARIQESEPRAFSSDSVTIQSNNIFIQTYNGSAFFDVTGGVYFNYSDVTFNNSSADFTGLGNLLFNKTGTTIFANTLTQFNNNITVSGKVSVTSPISTSNYVSLDMYSTSSNLLGLGIRASTLAAYTNKYFSVYGTNAAKTDSQYSFRVDATNGDTEVKGKLSVFSPISSANYCSLDLWNNSGQYGFGRRTSITAAYSPKYFSVYGTNSAKTDSQYAFRIDATNGNTEVTGQLSLNSPISTSNYVSLDMLPTSTNIYGFGIRSSTLAIYSRTYLSVYGTDAAKTDSQYAFRIDATNGNTEVTGTLSVTSPLSTSNVLSLQLWDNSNLYGFGVRSLTLATYTNKYFSVYGTDAAKTDAQYAFRIDARNGDTEVKGSLTTVGNLYLPNYSLIRILGGNTQGGIYTDYSKLGDGINLGYNYYVEGGNEVIPVSAGKTSRLHLGYGAINHWVGTYGTKPNVLMMTTDLTGVNFNGNITLGTNSPIQFATYTFGNNIYEINTGILGTEFSLQVCGWQGSFDIEELTTRNYYMYTYIKDGTWWVKCNAWLDTSEVTTFKVRVMIIHKYLCTKGMGGDPL